MSDEIKSANESKAQSSNKPNPTYCLNQSGGSGKSYFSHLYFVENNGLNKNVSACSVHHLLCQAKKEDETNGCYALRR